MLPADSLAEPSLRGDRTGVGPDRLHRVRRAARARRAVPRAVRDTPGMVDRRSVRAGDRGDEHPARTGIHAACDLLRVAAARPQGRTHRRPGLHPARPRDDPCAVGAVPRGIAARMDTGRRDGSRRRGCACRGQRRAGRRAPDLETHGRRTAAPHPALRARRRARGGHDRPVARARPAGVRCDRADAGSVGWRRRCGLSRLAAARHDRGARRDWRAGMDGVEGRGARVRRRVRDRPADAIGRGGHLPLDDPRTVPQRGRARAGHSGTGHPDRRGRRLLRRRAARRAPGSARRFRALVLFHPVRRRALRAPAAE